MHWFLYYVLSRPWSYDTAFSSFEFSFLLFNVWLLVSGVQKFSDIIVFFLIYFLVGFFYFLRPCVKFKVVRVIWVRFTVTGYFHSISCFILFYISCVLRFESALLRPAFSYFVFYFVNPITLCLVFNFTSAISRYQIQVSCMFLPRCLHSALITSGVFKPSVCVCSCVLYHAVCFLTVMS